MRAMGVLLVVVHLLAGSVWAQRRPAQIGLNVVPLFNRTLEINATFLGTDEHELYVHGGYTFPTAYRKKENEFMWNYWEGTASGAYLRLGGKAYLNKAFNFRPFFGAHITTSYLTQSGTSKQVIVCIAAPCNPWEQRAKGDDFAWSGGITGGVRTTVLPRLTLDVGVQANTFLLDKPTAFTNTIFIPGFGRRPVQAVASVQYTLKSR